MVLHTTIAARVVTSHPAIVLFPFNLEPLNESSGH